VLNPVAHVYLMSSDRARGREHFVDNLETGTSHQQLPPGQACRAVLRTRARFLLTPCSASSPVDVFFPTPMGSREPRGFRPDARVWGGRRSPTWCCPCWPHQPCATPAPSSTLLVLAVALNNDLPLQEPVYVDRCASARPAHGGSGCCNRPPGQYSFIASLAERAPQPGLRRQIPSRKDEA